MYDIAIIGAGPAGASAAMFTAKAGKKTALVDDDKGITRRAWIENHYPLEGVTGTDLVERGLRQAARLGAQLVRGTVEQVERRTAGEPGFVLRLADGTTLEAGTLLLATGVNTELAKRMGVPTKPASEPRIKEVVEVDSQGRTPLEGVWAAGVVAGTSVHTIVTAGDGARVAINWLSQLAGQRYVQHDAIQKPEKQSV
ncbi:MAG: FAD-dependent oxidoreductase [Firmicutes bacterium]|nr:FAD-dependent oxidoreductase [Bacillota bacterium]